MASPTVAATNTSTGTGTNHTVNLPANISSGNLLTVIFGYAIEGNTISWPADWTPIPNGAVEQAAGSSSCIASAYKQADGSEGASITVTSSLSTRSAHSSYRITGHINPSTQAPEAANAIGTNGQSDPPNKAVTGGSKDILVIAAGSNSGLTEITGAPANYTNLLNPFVDTGSAGSSTNLGTAQRQLTASSEDPGAFSGAASTSEWAALTIIIHPATGTQFNQSVSGGITPSGVISKMAGKIVAGSNTPSGTVNKSTSKSFSGNLSSIVGTVSKSVQKSLAGTISAITGTLNTARIILINLSGSITPSGTLDKLTAKSLLGSISSITGTIEKQTSKLFSGSATPSGTLSKTTSKLLEGALPLSGGLFKQIGKILSGILTTAGELITEFTGGATTYFKDLAGEIIPSGQISKLTSTSKSGTLSLSGGLLKLTQKLLSGILSAGGELLPAGRFTKFLEGVLESSGAISKNTSKEFSGTVSLSGQINKLISKTISGILNFIGNVFGLTGEQQPDNRIYLEGSIVNVENLTGSVENVVVFRGNRVTTINLIGKK